VFKALLISTCKLEWIERNTQLDFLFLITYTATLIFAFRTLTEDFQSAEKLKTVSWLIALPAFLDAVENCLLIKFLYADASAVSEATFSIYYWCVHIKFVLIAVILLTVIALFVRMGYRKIASPLA